MKVIYKKNIKEKIDDAILESMRNNRNIEIIELTKEEFDNFSSILSQLNFLYTGIPVTFKDKECYYRNILIRKEQQ